MENSVEFGDNQRRIAHSPSMRVDLALRRGLIYLLPLAVLFVALTLRITAPDLVERLSLVCCDFYQKAAPREAGDAPIRIVGIDNESLSKIGQ
jgi:adenylate cyclase